MRRIQIILIILIALCPTREAAAEYWAARTGELLEEARFVAVVVVESTRDMAFSGKVVRSIRGATMDTRVTYAWRSRGMARGDRVLVVCDRDLCPRAVGRPRGGYYLFTADQPMDGAQAQDRLLPVDHRLWRST